MTSESNNEHKGPGAYKNERQEQSDQIECFQVTVDDTAAPNEEIGVKSEDAGKQKVAKLATNPCAVRNIAQLQE
jgi:hypothetical protein